MHLSDTERACCVCGQRTRRLVNGWPVCVRCRVRRIEEHPPRWVYPALFWLWLGLTIVGALIVVLHGG